jgi:hypothetical protein
MSCLARLGRGKTNWTRRMSHVNWRTLIVVVLLPLTSSRYVNSSLKSIFGDLLGVRLLVLTGLIRCSNLQVDQFEILYQGFYTKAAICRAGSSRNRVVKLLWWLSKNRATQHDSVGGAPHVTDATWLICPHSFSDPADCHQHVTATTSSFVS